MTSQCEGVLLRTLPGAGDLSDKDKVFPGAPLPEAWWLQVPAVLACDLYAARGMDPSFPARKKALGLSGR